MVRKTDATNEHPHPKKNLKYTGVKERQTKDGEERVEAGERHLKTASEGGIKRKQPDQGESESEEVEEVVCISSSGEESVSMSLRNVASTTEPSRSGGSRGAVESERRALEGCLTRLGVRRLHLPDDPFLCSVFVTCLKSQPRVEKSSCITKYEQLSLSAAPSHSDVGPRSLLRRLRGRLRGRGD
uniref:Uncharacterized protein n=1 Tax=Gasterosteus aculeatus TaxID=69293 RepID=G3Q653_GASAC